MFYVINSGDSFDIQVLADHQGCPAGATMRTAEGLMWWYSGENVYETNGSNIYCISDPGQNQASKIRDILDSVPDTAKQNAVAAVYPRQGWYVLSLPAGAGATTPTVSCIFDYRNRQWWTRSHATLGAPSCYGDFLDSNEQPIVFAAFADAMDIYDFIGVPANLTDAGTPIVAEWTSAGLDCGAPGYMHRARRVTVLTNPVNSTITIKTYIEDQATPSQTVTGVSLQTTRQSRRVAVPTERAFHTQVHLSYSGAPQVLLRGVQILADVWGWQEAAV